MISCKLLTYIFQCRSKEFIDYFQSTQDKPCPHGVLCLYYYCYALDIIFGTDVWRESYMPTVEACRKGIREIKAFLCSQVEVSTDFETTFQHFVKENYQYYDEEDDFDWMLDGDIEKLKSQGYREVDCRLYEAGMKLHFDEMMDYLAKGGNPHAYISANYLAIDEESLKNNDCGWCLYEEALLRTEDLFICDDFGVIIGKGLQGIDVDISERDIRAVFMAASYQMVLNKIDDFEKNKA